MKIKIYLTGICTIILLFHHPVFAQVPTWQWAKSAGGSTYDDKGQSIAVDQNGNSFVTGVVKDPSITFGGITLSNPGAGNNSDIFIVKYDPSGNVLWAKRAGGLPDDESYGIVVDANGNSYITGFYSSDSITFGNTTLVNAGTYSIFIVKYDPAGNVIWARSSGDAHHGYGTGIALDSYNNVYVTGYFDGSTISFDTITIASTNGFGYNDVFTVKYDSSGNVKWANAVSSGSGQAKGFGITTDANDNSYCTGTFSGAGIAFDTTVLYNPNGAAIFIVKRDPSGNLIWARGTQGNNYDNVTSIDVDASGNAYITGSFASTLITFGNNTLNGNGATTVYIAKYDSAGNNIWAKRAGGNSNAYSNSIVADASGNSFITGNYNYINITFGSTNLICAGMGDVFIVKYDPSGNVVWAENAAGIGNDIGYGICESGNGSLFLTGSYNSSVISFGSTTLTNTITDNVFIAKMNTVTGIEEPMNTGSPISVFPNPGNGRFNIKCSSIIDEIKILNPLGQLIYHTTPNDLTLSLQLKGEGFYTLIITTTNQTLTRKIVVCQ